MRTRLAPTLSLAVALFCSVGGQVPSFRARIGLVVLPTTVKNSRGELVTTLERGDFSVYERGKLQPITLFSKDDVPVSLGLLIDNSGSMRTLRSRVEEAALSLVHGSNPRDEVFVINFADKVRLDVPFTTEPAALAAGIGRVDSIGGTALRDAIDAGETYLRDHASRDRKVLIVITDGFDNASTATLAHVRAAAEQGEVAIYAIGLFGDADAGHEDRGRRELAQLTTPTGGIALYPGGLDQVDAAALDIARQIRSQYTIAYAPLNKALDGSYRSIRVEARGRERLTVLTRAGYRATRDSGR